MSRIAVATLGLAAALAATLVLALPAQRAASAASPAPPACSADTLPAAEKAAMEREYARRTRAEGAAAADAWLREEARLFLERLVAEGVCTMDTPPPEPPAAATARAPAERPLGRDGKPCKRTRMENRAVANVSGGPMMMVLVPVCAD